MSLSDSICELMLVGTENSVSLPLGYFLSTGMENNTERKTLQCFATVKTCRHLGCYFYITTDYILYYCNCGHDRAFVIPACFVMAKLKFA